MHGSYFVSFSVVVNCANRRIDRSDKLTILHLCKVAREKSGVLLLLLLLLLGYMYGEEQCESTGYNSNDSNSTQQQNAEWTLMAAVPAHTPTDFKHTHTHKGNKRNVSTEHREGWKNKERVARNKSQETAAETITTTTTQTQRAEECIDCLESF